MTQRFHPGEIAIAHNWSGYPQYNGQDVEVMDALRRRVAEQHYDDGSSDVIVVTSYLVRTADGCLFAAEPQALRKRFDRGSWSDCAWRPHEVPA